MLALKPSCEHCDRDLPADAEDAMICSYECTFCKHCVDVVLLNVCPNCGGGFCPRPVRPRRQWRTGVSLEQHPAQQMRTLKPVKVEEHRSFAATLKAMDPRDR